MTTTSELLIDAFDRIAGTVQSVLDGIDDGALTYRPDPSANTVAWLVWHLTRVQDDHVAEVAGSEQVWRSEGFASRFGLPLEANDTGYGHSSDQVAAVRVDAALLREYHDAVHERSVVYLRTLADGDLDRIVDEDWDPPVTLAVRLVSVITDNLEHAGQAAYARGVAERSA